MDEHGIYGEKSHLSLLNFDDVISDIAFQNRALGKWQNIVFKKTSLQTKKMVSYTLED